MMHGGLAKQFLPAFAILGSAFALGVFAFAGTPETPVQRPEAERVQVLFPPNHAVLLIGTFEVIAKGPPVELRVDGRLRAWDNYQPPLHVAKVGFPPGLHEIRVGGQRIEFSVGLSEDDHEGPKDWPLYRRHTISAERSCGGCHVTSVQDSRIAVLGFRGSSACFECHRKERFESIHSHLTQPLEQCGSCHALHGSDQEAMLKPATKQAPLKAALK